MTEHTGCQALEATPICRRDAIPEFWGTIVKIADAVKIHVFNMPCEDRFPHPNIQVSCKCKIKQLQDYEIGPDSTSKRYVRVFTPGKSSVIVSLRIVSRFRKFQCLSSSSQAEFSIPAPYIEGVLVQFNQK